MSRFSPEIDHFDIYDVTVHEAIVADEIEFLHRHLLDRKLPGAPQMSVAQPRVRLGVAQWHAIPRVAFTRVAEKQYRVRGDAERGQRCEPKIELRSHSTLCDYPGIAVRVAPERGFRIDRYDSELDTARRV